jgi:uncharacterized membrane protein YphA (DoxX/SURF4 family)
VDLGVLAAIGYAAGLCGLGALSLIYQDAALQWEPLPASWPQHHALGAVSGLILLGAGAMLAMRRSQAFGAALGGVFIGLWALLHFPQLAHDPTNIGAWNGFAECVAMACGGLLLASESSRGGVTLSGRIVPAVFGLAAIVFGTAHFAYAQFTASMVPAWLPMRLELAYLTGAIHALTGLALVIGFQRRWAATVEALMMTSFVLLVHIPRVAAKPGDRTELTLLFVALVLSSSAWILATSRAATRR